MRDKNTKEKAVDMRKQGFSYSMISDESSLAKSTLSNWLKDIPYKANKKVLKRVQMAGAKSAETIIKRKIARIKKAKKKARKEFGRLSRRDLFLLGIGLYLGEGGKAQESVNFSNSDPQVIRIMVKWFRVICRAKKENFGAVLHSYPDINTNEALHFWSKTTKIPIAQFGKTIIDIRKKKLKKRKLRYGTLDLRIRASGNKNMGRQLHRRIMGWIETSSQQAR